MKPCLYNPLFHYVASAIFAVCCGTVEDEDKIKHVGRKNEVRGWDRSRPGGY